MDLTFRSRGGKQHPRGSTDWSHSPNYLRGGFFDQIEYDEEKVGLIAKREVDYNSADEIEDENFDRRTAEGGSSHRMHEKQGTKGEFQCIITQNASFLEKQAESEQVAGQLILVGVICAIFMVVEFIGGYLSNSSAIMTDAAHMLSDVMAMAVSVFSIKMGSRAPEIAKTYGFHRAEVLGALTSIIIIWVLVAWLCWEASLRMYAVIYKNGFPLDPVIMLITSFVSLVCNILNLYFLGMCSGDGHGIVDNVHSVFKPHGQHAHDHGPDGTCGHGHHHHHHHGHGHGHGHHHHHHDHEHEHQHDHGGKSTLSISRDQGQILDDSLKDSQRKHEHEHAHGHSCTHGHGHEHDHSHGHGHGHDHGHDHGHGHSHGHGHDHSHGHSHGHGHEHKHDHDHHHDHQHQHDHHHHTEEKTILNINHVHSRCLNPFHDHNAAEHDHRLQSQKGQDFKKKKKKHASPHFRKKQGTFSDSISENECEQNFMETQINASPKSSLSANAPAIRMQRNLSTNEKLTTDIGQQNQISSSSQLDVQVVDCCFKSCRCAKGNCCDHTECEYGHCCDKQCFLNEPGYRQRALKGININTMRNPSPMERPPSPPKSDYSPISHISAKSTQSQNLNIRSAVVHAVGDLIQSVGVIVAATIIVYRPNFQIADPICTYIFSVIVMFTTVPVAMDCYDILMEHAPKDVDVAQCKRDLQQLKAVREVEDIHVWSLGGGKVCLTAHLRLEKQTQDRAVTNLLNSSEKHSQNVSRTMTNYTQMDSEYMQRQRIYMQVQEIAEKHDICHTTVQLI